MSLTQTLSRVVIDEDPDAYVAAHGSLDESVADALLTDREREIRALTRRVVAEEVAPRAAETDRTHEFAGQGVRALASAGLGGLVFPERFGGSGDSHVAYAVAMEEITAGCAATSLVYMTQTHAAYPILLAGSEELGQKYIPDLLAARTYGSMAITEPDAGSDVSSIRTRAARAADGESYEISGAKTFITTGDRADVIVCFVTVDPKLGRDGVTAFVVDGDAPGVETGAPFEKMGMHGSSTAEVFLHGVPVAASQRLGGEGSGWQIVMSSVIKSRISAAAQGVGLARDAYLRTLIALHRIHGPRLPEDITFELAQLRGDILKGRLLLLATAREVDRSAHPSTAHIAIMKQACTDLGWRTALTATGLLAAYGDLADLGVERTLRDAKVTQIYDGTNEVQRLLIARDTQRRDPAPKPQGGIR
ncbi:acyl-CoA dehydrogenase family protein [Microbacterium timonense]|uniref:acyl-CoA dehydrogenase family protein n=1 Tax=Microbacterium timonense TaxID=2086576 RepID=UPI000D10F078|nr:acyl-CoA dehydrogenase family protein [Microbacterium timonense]